MSVAENSVNVPPYVGLPSLSHHFPVAEPVEVVEVGFVVDTVEVVMLEVEVVVFVVFVVVVVVVVVVALLQDAKSIDVTIRNVIASQITPFFQNFLFFHLLEN